MAKGGKQNGAGRPEADIDDAKLKAICRLKPTLADCAAFFDVHEDTVRQYIKRHYGCNFPTFREKYLVETRFMLVRKALEMAKNGNTAMMIFCLKNICKWADRVEHTDAPVNTLQLAYDVKDKPKIAAASDTGEVIEAEEVDSGD